MTVMSHLDYITSNPDICGGKPCVAGTRMRVRDVLEYLAAGDTVDDLLEFYPYLSREAILACISFAADRSDFPVFRTAAE